MFMAWLVAFEEDQTVLASLFGKKMP